LLHISTSPQAPIVNHETHVYGNNHQTHIYGDYHQTHVSEDIGSTTGTVNPGIDNGFMPSRNTAYGQQGERATDFAGARDTAFQDTATSQGQRTSGSTPLESDSHCADNDNNIDNDAPEISEFPDDTSDVGNSDFYESEDQKKWTLPSTRRVVEDIIKNIYPPDYEGSDIFLRGCILNLSDRNVTREFLADELSYIRSHLPSLPSLPEQFVKSLDRFKAVCLHDCQSLSHADRPRLSLFKTFEA
jgi:hypothetical protein